MSEDAWDSEAVGGSELEILTSVENTDRERDDDADVEDYESQNTPDVGIGESDSGASGTSNEGGVAPAEESLDVIFSDEQTAALADGLKSEVVSVDDTPTDARAPVEREPVSYTHLTLPTICSV